jgi:4-oxalocrotonate tautomerase family enzyme
MPIINIKVVAGTFSLKQENELLHRVRDAVVAVYPEMRDFTLVTIEEVVAAEWGLAVEIATTRRQESPAG